MKTIGIVCEYNPFHLGHEYQIRRARELAGEECAVVCVMSGDFVQRGEPACMTKYARAEAALMCGADLVIELPLPWSIASAEGFAEAAVYLLDSAGADYISFGAECADTRLLTDIARCILSDSFREKVRDMMQGDRTMPYAAAREAVLITLLGERAGLIRLPNNILAVEYLKAIERSGYDIKPIAVPRQGNPHDSRGREGFLSSGEIRRMLAQGEDTAEYVLESVYNIICREREAGRVIDRDRFDASVMARLRMLPPESFALAPDGDSGAGERLYNAVRTEASLDEAVMKAYTKRYAISRMRRIALCAALGITEGLSSEKPKYARILAANTVGCGIIRNMNINSACPPLTKPAQVRRMTDTAQQIFTLGSDAHDLFVLGFVGKNERKGYKDWKNSPFIVNSD